MPSSFTWSGAGGNASWSNAGNWQGNVAPTGIPANQDSLSFPAGLAAGLRTANNDISNGTFFSITISDANYTIAGKSITLGSGSISGSIIGSSTNDIVALDIALGASAGSKQFFTVGNGNDLTLSGKLSGSTGSIFTKDGGGVLILANDNSNFTGPIAIDNAGGSLRITNSKALGDSTGDTTVGTNATLEVSNVVGAISEPIRLNGPGVANLGALRSVAGANTWTGAVILDSNATFGADLGTSVNIAGVISDTGVAHNVVKEGRGEVRFSGANTYRGSTTINNGILTAANASALGFADATAASGTVVNETLNKAGQLRIAGPAGSGFTILNERLNLNGDALVGTDNAATQLPYGADPYGLGAIYNLSGNNNWAGPVSLGSANTNTNTNYAALGAASGTDLIISGIVRSTPGTSFLLEKVEPGRVILNNVNTYTGNTRVHEGILNIRDSKALGNGSVDVNVGGTLELEVEAATTTPRFGYDETTGNATGRDLWDDSVTHDPNRLQYSNQITIDGRGSLNGGALRSRSGINQVLVNVAMNPIGTQAAIGVDLDPRPGHPTPGADYFTNDYSLTVLGTIAGGSTTNFIKRGLGHLILPTANTYTGETFIETGWVTIQNNAALGARIPGLGDTVQPGTFITTGAALHLKKLNPTSADLTINENITIGGVGPTLPYAFISGKGGLMNLGGFNTWSGDISLLGTAGIGVEQVDPLLASELTVTGSTRNAVIKQSFNADGGETEQSFLIDTGSTSGTIAITYDFYGIPDDLRVYYPPRTAGTRIYDTGLVSGAATINVPYGPGTSTLVEIVMNEGGGQPGTAWTFSIALPSFGGSLYKYGSQRLRLQGDGTYTGDTRVLEGTLRAEHDTALGRKSSGTLTTQQTYSQTTTSVSSGAVLETAKGIPTNNGGISAGIEIFDERLVLNAAAYQVAVAGDPLSATFTLNYTGPAGTTFTTQQLPITSTALDVQTALFSAPITTDGETASVTKVGNVFSIVFGTAISKDLLGLTATVSGGAEVKITDGQSSLINVSDDNIWRGPVTLEGGTRARVGSNSRLTLLGAIDDDPTNNPTGSQFAKRGNGELALGGLNSYRGTTLIDQGIVTAMNNLAFGFGDGTAASGTIVSANAQLQIQGNLDIASEALTVSGSGPNAASVPSAIPVRWLEIGGGPINFGQAPGNLPVTGRVTGTVIDPTDPNVIYISTAGGGAWKTKDGGHTWLPLFDRAANSNTIPLRGGTIALDPDDPRVIIYGTGEANNSGDSFAGTGVYISQDSGRTWNLLPGGNPIFGQSVAKIVIEPASISGTGSRIIYVGTSDFQVHATPAGAPGVWRHDGTNWVNMTAQVSVTRATQVGQAPFTAVPPNTPGPDDDYRIRFPQSNVTWTDLALVYFNPSPGNKTVRPVLYAALTEAGGAWAGGGYSIGGYNSGVFRTETAHAANPVWLVGDSGETTSQAAKPDNRSNTEFPAGPWTSGGFADTTLPPRNGRIAIAVVSNGDFSTTSAWAAVAYPIAGFATDGSLLEIRRTQNSGVGWTALAIPIVMQGYLANQGWYDNTIVAADLNTLYVGGASGSHVWRGTVAGINWQDISVDGAGNGPHADDHAMTLIPNTSNPALSQLLLGNDGGVYKYSPTAAGLGTWNDLNGNLAITTYKGIATHPFDFNIAYGASQDNGTEKFTGSQAWTHIDDGDGGIVQLDQINPNTVYHVLNGRIQKSTNGGSSWNSVFFGSGLYYPFVLDQIDTQRLVTADGAGGLWETLDGGANGPASWNFISATYPGGAASGIALASYQGNFAPDPGFGTIGDIGSNTYDSKTIYVNDSTNVYVTKDDGLTWRLRSGGLSGTIEHIAVDPSNRDTAYAVVSSIGGGAKVYRTTNAGINWTNISGTGLPVNQPVWTIVVDPRDGSLYVGTDVGVYASKDVGTTWSKFGGSNAMPNVHVTDLVLNQTLNTLSAGTYGRSMFQIFLNYAKADSGAIRAVSGNSSWNGPVTLAGNTRIEVDGTQNIQNGIAAASLNILGNIGDAAPGGYSISKTGKGTLVFSGANTYTGQTFVTEGVLQANNSSALGTAAGNTIVSAGAALELASDLYFEPVVINGDGFLFNGHYTGALRNVSGFNTYTGLLTLGTKTTIGVNSGSQLTIGGKPGNPGVGTGSIAEAGFGLNIDKELTGTLVLASANAISGTVNVIQGALRVEDAGAFGGTARGVIVYDGAQLQISRNNVTLAPTVVASETLWLSGTGIFGTGAITNVRGDAGPGSNDNVWQGPILLRQTPNFSPTTTPPKLVALGSSDSRDTLTLDTVITEESASFVVNKVGPGRVTFTKDNTYSGQTNVNAGALRIQTNGGLGTGPAGTVVNAGSLELDGNGLLVVEVLTLNGLGVSNAGALNNVSGNNIYGGPIALASNTSIGAAPGTQLTVTGLVQDPATVPVPAADLHKAGSGTVIFPTPNSYGGQTIVDGGILQIQTPTALGTPRDEQQTIDVLGTNGSFALSFRGQTTAPLSILGAFPTPAAAQLKAALESLSTIGGVGGTVNVAVTNPPGTSRYVVTFGGTLQNANVPAIETIYVAPTFATVQNGTAALPEIQTVRVTASPSPDANFGLTFNGFTTTAIPVNASAATVQAALNAIPSIGGIGGSVAVFRAGPPDDYTYTIQFGGALATGNQNPLGSAVVGGALLSTATNIDGQGGTTVNSGGTLQILGSQTFVAAGELLTLNGQGFNNIGALNISGGNAVWNPALPILLGSNASIGTTNPGDSLTIYGPISDSGGAFGLDIYGPGTIAYAGTLGDEIQRIKVIANGASPAIVLGFQGVSTSPISITGGAAADALAIQTALNGLSSILPGSVAVTPFAGHPGEFTVDFANPAFTLQSLLTGTGSNAWVSVAETQRGALATGTSAGLSYTTHTGTTTVHSGTLLLSQTGGRSILGPLVVGDGVGGSALVLETLDNQVADSSPVTVGSDGTFDLNAKTDAIGNLTAIGGTVFTRANGHLTTADIDMTGGIIDVGDGGSLVQKLLPPALPVNVATLRAGARIVAGNNTTVALGDTSLDASSIAFGSPATFSTGNLTLANGSTIALPLGTMTSLDIFMTGGSIALGDDSTLTARNVTDIGGTISLGQRDTFTATGTVSVSTGGLIQLDLNGLFAITGNLTLNDGTVKLGNATVADKAKLTTADATLTGTTARIQIGDNGHLNASGKVTGTGGAIALGNYTLGVPGGVVDFTAGGPVSLTAGSVTFGTGGFFNNQPNDLTLNNSQFAMGDTGTAKTKNVSLSNSSKIAFGNGGTLDAAAGNLTMIGGSTLAFLNAGTATTQDIAITGGAISFLDSGKLQAGNVNDLGANIAFGNTGKFTAGTVNVSVGGSIGLGADGLFTATRDATLDGATFSMGDGNAARSTGIADVRNLTLLNASKATFGNRNTLTDRGLLTLGGSSQITFQDFGKATALDVSQNAGLISFQNGGELDSANYTGVGGTVSFQNLGAFKAAAVSVTNGSIGFVDNGVLATTGNLTLTKASVTLANNGAIATKAVAMTTAGPSKIQMGDLGTLDTTTVNVGSGGSIVLGNSDAFTAAGTVTVANAPISFGTNGLFKITGNLNLSNSQLTLGTTGKVQLVGTGDANLSLASRIVFADSGTLVANGNATMTGVSKLSFGNTGSANVQDLTITTGSIAMLNGSSITVHGNSKATDAAVSLGSGSSFTVNGNASFATVGASTASFAIGAGSSVNTGNFTLAAANATFGALTNALILDWTITGLSKINAGNNVAINAKNVTDTAGTFIFGNNASLIAVGDVSFTNVNTSGTVTFGTTGTLTATGSLRLNSVAMTFGAGGTVAVNRDASIDNKSKIVLGDNGKFTALGTLNLDNGQLKFGNTGSLAAGATTLVNSTVSGGTNIVVTLGNLSMDPSTVAFGNGSTVNTGNIDIIGGSFSLGNNTSLNAGNIADNGAIIALGTNSTLTANDVTVASGGVNLGNGDSFSAGAVSLTNTAFNLGVTGSFTTTGNLSLATSTIDLGSGGSGTTQGVSLTSSSIAIGSGTRLDINGGITADSTFVGGSSIAGLGAIGLGGTAHAAIVGNGDGVDNVDLSIATGIVATSAARLNKSGLGRLQLAPPSGTLAGLNIAQGDVQVDTAVAGPATLTGGTLSGIGAVGALDATVGGTVAPGDNANAATAGILGSGSAVWGPQTTFKVDLSSSVPNAPIAGTDYDQLQVAGNIDLGNAVLDARYGNGILLGDSFTIVTYTGTRTGKFQQFNSQDITFVGGQKFTIDYTGTPGSVILHKVRADATIAMTSAPNPSTRNQTVTLTATVVPELGSILIPNTTTVTFFIDGNPTAPVFVNLVGSLDQAAFATATMTVGTHVLTARFDGDANNFNSSNTPLPNASQVVQQPTVDPLVGVPGGTPGYISPNNSAGVQDQYVLSTTVRQEYGAGIINWHIDIKDASSTIVRTLTGSGNPGTTTILAINASWDGKNTGGTFVPDGNYTATVTVQSDSFGNIFSAAPIPVVVDNTSPSSTANPASPILFDPTGLSSLPNNTLLTGTVGDANLAGWTVDISNGAVLLREYSGTGTTVSVNWNGLYDPADATDPINPTTVAPDAAYTIAITAIDRAGNRTTSTAQTVVVLANGPVVAVDTGAPTVYGTAFTIAATVELPAGSPASLYSLLNGDTINFFQGLTSLGSGTLTPLAGSPGKFQTSVVGPILNAGTYSNFKAVYPATTDFPTGVSALASHTVTQAPLTVTAANKSRLYGAANPPFTFTTTGLVNGDAAATVLSGSLATTATAASNVGTYPIAQGTLTPNGNYQIASYSPGTLTVLQAPLTIRVDDKSRPLFKANPAFTYIVQGLVNGDPASVVTSVPLSTAATLNSPVGSYPIVSAGVPTVGSNYVVVSIVPGSLAITPALTTFSIGSGAGGIATVSLYSPDRTLIKTFTPFGSFFGGVRTVTADFNGDHVDDLAVGTGPGAVAQVSVFDGVTGASLFTTLPFETSGVPSFTGGVFVAAGDINGDGVAELVVTPDEGGGPRVLVYSGTTFTPMLSYFGINDPNFRGGARASVGDINGDGYADIAVSAGFQGGPRVSIWDGKALVANKFQNLVNDFFVFEQTLRNGAYVAIGDVNGDGFGDLITGAGPGGGPRVEVFSGADLLNPAIGPARTTPFANFFAGDINNRGGVRVAAKVFDSDLFVDVLTGVGEGGGDTATAYLGVNLKSQLYAKEFELDAFPGLNNNGVFVG